VERPLLADQRRSQIDPEPTFTSRGSGLSDRRDTGFSHHLDPRACDELAIAPLSREQFVALIYELLGDRAT
jgi:hypothetical protein